MQRKLTIIGCGNVGKALGHLWFEHRTLEISQILNRSRASAARAVSFIGAGQAISRYEELVPADIYMIGVPDDQIKVSSEQLAATGLLTQDSIVFHCSGSLPSTAMQAVIEKGAHAASVHPIRSFASPEQVVSSFAGTWCGMEGNRQALDILAECFRSIGAHLAELASVDALSKMLYHSAAVFASNYLVTLLDIAVAAYAKAGIPEDTALQMIAPLVRKTVDNVLTIGPEKALSGPIARGDMDTVDSQYRAIQAWDEECGRLYEHLANRTVKLARRRKK